MICLVKSRNSSRRSRSVGGGVTMMVVPCDPDGSADCAASSVAGDTAAKASAKVMMFNGMGSSISVY